MREGGEEGEERRDRGGGEEAEEEEEEEEDLGKRGGSGHLHARVSQPSVAEAS